MSLFVIPENGPKQHWNVFRYTAR